MEPFSTDDLLQRVALGSYEEIDFLNGPKLYADSALKELKIVIDAKEGDLCSIEGVLGSVDSSLTCSVITNLSASEFLFRDVKVSNDGGESWMVASKTLFLKTPHLLGGS